MQWSKLKKNTSEIKSCKDLHSCLPVGMENKATTVYVLVAPTMINF